LPAKIRVNVPQKDAGDGLRDGATVALSARLMPPAEAAVPGAYDFARLAWFQGVGATGRTFGPVKVTAPGVAPVLGDARQRLSTHIQSRLAGGEGAIAAALATGDQGAIPEADAEAMRASGLAHLLSVSGLHLTAVVGATMLLVLRLLALSPALALRWPLVLIAAATGAVTGIAYTLLTGAEVPTIRSCVAAILVLIGIALGRDAITLRLVAAGALFVLVFWPESLVGPSFQLSFAAVVAIIALVEHPRLKALLARRDEGPLAASGRVLLGLLLTGFAVEIALAPIAVHHFHKAGLYGALANIVAIPLTTFIIMPLEGAALAFDLVGAGAPFWWIAGKALSLLLWIAHHVANLPGAVAALPVIPDAAFGLMVAGGLWLALWRTRIRRLGFAPILVGAVWALATSAPDILVTGDGRHLAVRSHDGSYALLRPRAGDYVRDMLSESAGFEGELMDLDVARGANCSLDSCTVELIRGTKRWRLLAMRSAYLVQPAQLRPACRDADIVVSERRLPDWCAPRWIKADRALLMQTGGLAIDLDSARIRTVRHAGDDHGWANPPKTAMPPRISNGGAARRAGPARGSGPDGNAEDHKRGSPDRAGPSPLRGGNI
jgi:competence protein ComEC